MLILPLHHRVELRHLPWMSLLIALVCVLVHFGPQQDDQQRWARADEQYARAKLGEIEAPLYRAWAATHPEALLHSFGEEPAADEALRAWLMKGDRGFRVALAKGEGFADGAAHAEWQSRSAAYRQTVASMFDERYAMHTDAPRLGAALSSAFLHADAGHLFGNLVFLLVIGLLVERAMGPWLFLALYLASGVAAAWAFTLAWNGPATTLVGASGAIAGLMGALCVLWGLRRIRFFYWFIVVFDYVRAPALWLLPAWLGWELFQWAMDEGGNIAYQAHAGGIVAGAALALAVKTLRWDRPEAYDEQPDGIDDPAPALARARTALGRLDFATVDRELGPLLDAMPVPLEARLIALQAALLARGPVPAEAQAGALLAYGAAGDRPRVLDALHAWRAAGGRWRPDDAFAHAELLLRGGRGAEAVGVLAETSATGALPADWAARWLRLGFDLRRDGDELGARRLFAALLQALPETPEAAKAGAQLAG